MKERPILFSAPMVRAILDGQKTQTRRVVKLREFQQTDTPGYDFIFRDRRALWNDYRTRDLIASKHNPYGKPGDRLWVREAFTQITGNGIRVHYRADGEPLDSEGKPLPTRPGTRRWWPSIHMPRKYSRITLAVTAVRVERLHAITDVDAKAEGAAHRISPGGDLAGAFSHVDTPIGYRNHFADLWRSLNGAESWDANPWVWVIEFGRIDAHARAA